jgi:hypothetical protein
VENVVGRTPLCRIAELFHDGLIASCMRLTGTLCSAGEKFVLSGEENQQICRLPALYRSLTPDHRPLPCPLTTDAPRRRGHPRVVRLQVGRPGAPRGGDEEVDPLLLSLSESLTLSSRVGYLNERGQCVVWFCSSRHERPHVSFTGGLMLRTGPAVAWCTACFSRVFAGVSFFEGWPRTCR